MARVAYLVVFAAFLALACGYDPKNDPFLYKKFPDGFMWGTATASYQIEGAWNVSGKGENIWDTFTHEGGNVVNNDTGDVACDSYNNYKRDVELLKELGANHYRMSISWSRVFPNGSSSSYNEAGMKYYKDVLKELKDNNIKTMVTLYHWDLPQALEDEGGWLNETIIPKFEAYADKVFEQLGDKVDLWITFNEPFVTCWLGYGIGAHAPGKSDGKGTYPYQCVHNIIRSHAKAWHKYDKNYRKQQKGKISITLDIDWKEPETNSTDDRDAAERALQFKVGWFAHPIFKNGDYPPIMKVYVDRKSLAQGLNESRLPQFTNAEKTEINGTYDFFGLNHYTTNMIRYKPNNDTDPNYEKDQDIEIFFPSDWKRAASSWLYEVPWGFRKLLNWLKNEYNNTPLYVTENGVSDNNGTLQDQHRIDYYKSYINNMLKAIDDGCDIKGYTAWSLMDNFEWAMGYTEKFGLHFVDFNDPGRPRVAKQSAKWYKQLIADNGWDDPNTSTEGTTPSNPNTSTPNSASMLAYSLPFIIVSKILSTVSV